MHNTEKSQFPRRAFLQRATAAVGTTLLGAIPASTLAANLGGGTSQPFGDASLLSVGYWDGKRIIAADELPSGDLGLSLVAISIRSFGQAHTMRGFDANALLVNGKETRRVPFKAWVAGDSGVKEVAFVMTSDSVQGLVFTSHVQTGKTVSEVDVQLIPGADDGNKLREGVYVIACGSMNWSSYSYDSQNANAPLKGPAGEIVSLPYLVLTLSRT